MDYIVILVLAITLGAVVPNVIERTRIYPTTSVVVGTLVGWFGFILFHDNKWIMSVLGAVSGLIGWVIFSIAEQDARERKRAGEMLQELRKNLDKTREDIETLEKEVPQDMNVIEVSYTVLSDTDSKNPANNSSRTKVNCTV